MSEQEEKLRRLQAWDDYRAARTSYLAHRAKLKEMSDLLRRAAARLEMSPFVQALDGKFPLPPDQDAEAAIGEMRSAAESLRRTWSAAKDFGFTVDPDDLKALRNDE